LRDRASDTIYIEANVESGDADTGVRRVRCTITFDGQPSFSAIVLLGESYRHDLDWDLADSSADGPWPFGIEEVYGEHRMFHGPSFHVVTALNTLGNPGASGTLKSMPRDRLFASRPDPLLLTDPCLMDGVGQFVGLFTQVHKQYILPVGVEKIEFLAPPPAPGTPVPIRMEVVACDLDARQFRFNVELEDGAGRMWAKLAGWSDWILKWSERYHDSSRNPYANVLSEEIELPHLPEGSVCTMVTREFFAGVDMDWAARTYLHEREMPAYWEQTKERRRQTVMSRAALKDAVRLWWSRRHHAPLTHPAEFALGHDALGRPFLEPEHDPELPHVSFAHTTEGAVAIVSGLPVGIDLEPAERDTRSILHDFATADERVRIEDLAVEYPGEAFETRLWCAKEAASKALGTGLRGRPKDFEAIEADEAGAFLIHHVLSGERLTVHSIRVERFVIAVTALTTGNSRAGGSTGTAAIPLTR
jgi:phosphopantetheinyl transferase